MARLTLLLVALLSAAHSIAALHPRHDGEDDAPAAPATTTSPVATTSPLTTTTTPILIASGTSTRDHDQASTSLVSTTTKAPVQGTTSPSTTGHDHGHGVSGSSSSSGSTTRNGSAVASSPVPTGGAGRAVGGGAEFAWMGVMAGVGAGALGYFL